MSNAKDDKATQDRSHIYDGWAARPVDDSFWRATNVTSRPGEPSPFAKKQEQRRNEGPAPSNG